MTKEFNKKYEARDPIHDAMPAAESNQYGLRSKVNAKGSKPAGSSPAKKQATVASPSGKGNDIDMTQPQVPIANEERRYFIIV